MGGERRGWKGRLHPVAAVGAAVLVGAAIWRAEKKRKHVEALKRGEKWAVQQEKLRREEARRRREAIPGTQCNDGKRCAQKSDCTKLSHCHRKEYSLPKGGAAGKSSPRTLGEFANLHDLDVMGNLREVWGAAFQNLKGELRR